MKLTEYLGVSSEELQRDYINAGLVDTAHHPQFPLTIMTYSRKTVADGLWDKVTTKCRGLIVNEETDEIVSRPFEKFFNYGELFDCTSVGIANEPDSVVEKVDGFLCTLYTWQGQQYIASKGSFDSIHAKWATAWLRNHGEVIIPDGHTAVFEGVTPNLRIVVDYGLREDLTLLAVINNETGEEVDRGGLLALSRQNNFRIPARVGMTLAQAAKLTLNPDIKNAEGYVLVWNRPGTTPFRLKMKYQDYIRVHRMVCGTSPRRILDALINGWSSELDTWLDESTPWFNKFVSKWKNSLESAYKEIETNATKTYEAISAIAKEDVRLYDRIWTRKEWAERFTAELNKPIKAVLFALLDGKDPAPIIWKLVKPLIKGSQPMVDASKL